MEPNPHRLPTTVRPARYAVDIRTDPDRADFGGTVEMSLDVLDDVECIEMHAKGLELSNAAFTHSGRTELGIEVDRASERVRFHIPAQARRRGRVDLAVDFRGTPNPGMHGLYLARDGEERAVCTQCEATDARAIFPCFDEPEFKASIAWTVRTRGDVLALSNAPLASVSDEGGEKVWRFGETEKFSSYLVALAVGAFEGTEPSVAGGTPLRVFAPRGKLRQARFAHEFTEKLFPWYEHYFGIAYPYAKYDQVAVPGFDAGAMENVGLVLFRQNLLLMDEKAASWNQEKIIAKVIAHELAHMWFGNLVTMRWWDDLWLNEAFAEWFAHKATHAVSPNYLVWNDFQSDKNRALVDDALPTTHPIWTAVSTPSEALEMFDVITYQKGCAVMRMLENFLGEEAFCSGIRSYMRSFAGGNASGDDLWRHLQVASNQPVGGLMRSWIDQPGFPLLDLELDEASRTVSVSQRRFFSSPAAAREANTQLWNVPVVLRFEDDRGAREHRFILDARERTEPLPASGKVRFVYGNADEIGFYRLNTRGVASDRLLEHGLTRLSAVEQMGLIEDCWALVRNDLSRVEAFLPVLDALSKSREHNVVRSLSDRLGALDRLLRDAGERKARDQLRAHIAELFAEHLAELGFEPREGESQNDLQRRALAIYAMAALARRREVIESCERYAEMERRDPRSVDANLAGTFVGVAAKFGDAERYERWISTYVERKAKSMPPQDTLRYLHTLSAFRPEELTNRTLGHVDTGLVPQEAVGSIIAQLLASRHGQGLAWHYLKNNWQSLRSRVGDMGISRVVEAVGHLPGEHRQEIVEFFAQNPPQAAERALARALESLDQREELRARIVPDLVRLLARLEPAPR